MPLFAAVPRSAFKRRKEVSKGAYELFFLYCMFRDLDTGVITATLSEVAAELDCTYTHASHLRSELVSKDWIELDGRDEVIILLGADELPQPRVRDLSKVAKNRKQSCEKSQLSTPKVAKNRKQSCEKSQLSGGSPYNRKEVVEAAASAAAGGASPTDETPLDTAYVEGVKQRGTHPAEYVDFILRKLFDHCRAQTEKFKYEVQPTRGQFEWWLANERTAPAQASLFGAPVLPVPLHQTPARSKRVRPPRPDCELCRGEGMRDGAECPCTFCPRCYGTGFERVEGGSRKCACRSPGPAPPVESEPEAAAVNCQKIIGG